MINVIGSLAQALKSKKQYITGFHHDKKYHRSGLISAFDSITAFIHSFIHSFIVLICFIVIFRFAHLFYSCMHCFSHLFFHAFIIHPFIHLSIHLFIHTIISFIHSFIFIHSHSFFYSFLCFWFALGASACILSLMRVCACMCVRVCACTRASVRNLWYYIFNFLFTSTKSQVFRRSVRSE